MTTLMYIVYMSWQTDASDEVRRDLAQSYFVPKMRSPASPNPGKIYPFSLS